MGRNGYYLNLDEEMYGVFEVGKDSIEVQSLKFRNDDILDIINQKLSHDKEIDIDSFVVLKKDVEKIENKKIKCFLYPEARKRVIDEKTGEEIEEIYKAYMELASVLLNLNASRQNEISNEEVEVCNAKMKFYKNGLYECVADISK